MTNSQELQELNEALQELRKGDIFCISIGNDTKPYSNIHGANEKYNPYYEIDYHPINECFRLLPINKEVSINNIEMVFTKYNMKLLSKMD